jgi:hypothetical protein
VTETPTQTPTNTVTPTVTPSADTPTPTPTPTVTPTNTVTPSVTPTNTVTPSVTPSANTPTPTVTPTNTLTPTVTPTVTPSANTPTPTPTNTVTPTPTNTVTPTPTSTPRDCAGCTSYDVVISQADLDAISGNTDNKIYLYYYPCGSATQEFVTYSSAGTYSNEICSDNCATPEPYSTPEPYLYSSFDGGSVLTNSYLVEIAGDCSPSMLKTFACASGSVINTVSSEGLNKMLNTFELNNTYGNYNVTISATTLNTTTEIFVGNYGEKIGEVFELAYGTNNITKNVGYLGTNNSKILDIVVYSKNNGTFIPFDLNVSATCSDTISCDEVVSGTETYRQDVVINVTDAGHIIYNTETGQQSLYVPVGSKTLTDCLIVESIKSPLVLSDTATFTITYSGNTCTITPELTIGDCVSITFDAKYGFSATAYWIDCDGVTRTRFVNIGETFTTLGQYGSGSGLPVTYGEQAIQ